MKVKVDIDISPEEVRRLFGLPDLESFQRQILDDIRERMRAGVEGYDPLKLYEPYLKGTLASWDLFQRMLVRMVTPAATSKPGEGSDQTDA
ncbi:hypothetical protein GWK36_04675 [Caldichromatium japonicum]|uniref:Uncharacterized protein n=1 Tax=Caldichromatium japonicum TaxID=2699430 RepID=A0A6G7VBE2_9GAMM|nr:DUF6489 family protein [Caldichromatium japonicum]QIK37393.1 hypothetical protein GWK36_04675 [Caldichromatium japonicum]